MKKEEFKNKLNKMTEKELYDACENYIWLSAYANNNPRSDYHWMCDMCYDECKEREKLDIYQKAYDYHTKN